MTGRVYVGTSGWSYPKGKGAWDGVFYPEGMADKEKLGYYARFFDAVEVNSSFYRPPSPFVTRAWAARVPEDFRFTAKLWQKFTHPRMFEEATGRVARVSPEDFETFVGGIAPLAEAEKLGAILAQFPPSFKPEGETLDYLDDLVRRLRGEGFPLAVELRHRDWTDSEDAAAVRRLMEEEGVAWVMIDEPRFRTSIRDVPLTSHDLGYFRFHGRNYKEWWHHESGEDRYNYFYAPEEQKELTDDVRDVASRTREAYAFYNNHYGAKAVVNALQLQMSLGQRPPDEPLPDALKQRFEGLEELVSRSRST